MSVLYYWTGTKWEPISSGGGGAVGPAGPPGADGQSVEVFGPQPAPPTPIRKGDVWLFDGVIQRADEFEQLPPDVPPNVVSLREETE
jgi:hypothetical protein